MLNISFNELLKSDLPLSDAVNPVVPMDLDNKNPAVRRLIKNSARRVIKQHQKRNRSLKG